MFAILDTCHDIKGINKQAIYDILERLDPSIKSIIATIGGSHLTTEELYENKSIGILQKLQLDYPSVTSIKYNKLNEFNCPALPDGKSITEEFQKFATADKNFMYINLGTPNSSKRDKNQISGIYKKTNDEQNQILKFFIKQFFNNEKVISNRSVLADDNFTTSRVYTFSEFYDAGVLRTKLSKKNFYCSMDKYGMEESELHSFKNITIDKKNIVFNNKFIKNQTQELELDLPDLIIKNNLPIASYGINKSIKHTTIYTNINNNIFSGAMKKIVNEDEKSAILFDMKAAGDALSVKSAAHFNFIFLTGDLTAFYKALLCGCDCIYVGNRIRDRSEQNTATRFANERCIDLQGGDLTTSDNNIIFFRGYSKFKPKPNQSDMETDETDEAGPSVPYGQSADYDHSMQLAEAAPSVPSVHFGPSLPPAVPRTQFLANMASSVLNIFKNPRAPISLNDKFNTIKGKFESIKNMDLDRFHLIESEMKCLSVVLLIITIIRSSIIRIIPDELKKEYHKHAYNVENMLSNMDILIDNITNLYAFITIPGKTEITLVNIKQTAPFLYDLFGERFKMYKNTNPPFRPLHNILDLFRENIFMTDTALMVAYKDTLYKDGSVHVQQGGKLRSRKYKIKGGSPIENKNLFSRMLLYFECKSIDTNINYLDTFLININIGISNVQQRRPQSSESEINDLINNTIEPYIAEFDKIHYNINNNYEKICALLSYSYKIQEMAYGTKFLTNADIALLNSIKPVAQYNSAKYNSAPGINKRHPKLVKQNSAPPQSDEMLRAAAAAWAARPAAPAGLLETDVAVPELEMSDPAQLKRQRNSSGENENPLAPPTPPVKQTKF
jgi:hypothetical protein